MTTYAYSNASTRLQYPLKLWPLSIWLGGHYVNITRLGYTPHAHTKADDFLSSYLHLAACTTKYLFMPYVTYSRKSISVCLLNGQSGSFPNQHFFEPTSFEKFKLLKPEYLQNKLIVTYMCIQDNREEVEEEEEEAALSPLTDLMETDDDGSLDLSTETAVLPLPHLSPVYS